MVTALKILSMQVFVSCLTQGEKPYQNSRGLDYEHFDTLSDSIGLFFEQNDVFSPAPTCLLQVDGIVQTNANQA